ncbi:MAG: NAD-dependent deacylase [Caldisericia bacterium]|nr:NAD-dependent deacylase [Caldisericia bacterium]
MIRSIEDAARVLSQAKKVAVLTGAGVSQESGIETFRDENGVWSKLDPMIWATVEGFLSQPENVWDWYEQRRLTIRNSKPNAGHLALSKMESIFESLAVATQNIDGYHQSAGSGVVRELHGNIFKNKCLAEDICKNVFDSSVTPPKCLECGSFIRPDVVWFGEMLPEKEWSLARDDVQECDVYMVIGTSGMVWPAAGLPTIAKRKGAKIIIINTTESEIDQRADVLIRGKSGEVLPQILKLLEK